MVFVMKNETWNLKTAYIYLPQTIMKKAEEMVTEPSQKASRWPGKLIYTGPAWRTGLLFLFMHVSIIT